MDFTTYIIKSIKSLRFEQEHLFPIVSIATATAILYQSCRLISANSSLKKQDLKDIPVPGSCYPLIGHAFSLGEIPGETVKQWHKECGPIIKLNMGRRIWIMIDDPVLAHKIFVTHGASTSFRPYSNFAHKLYSGGGKNIAFSQPGGVWKRNRAAVLSILQPKQIENYIPFIRKETFDLAQRLMDYTERNGSVDPFKHAELNFMNVIFGHCFGRVFDCVENEEFIQVAQLVEDSIKYLAIELDYTNFLPYLSGLDFLTGGTIRKMKALMKKKRSPLFKQYIKETESKEGHNFVKALNESGYDLNEDEKLVFLFELVVAGTDTLAVTTTWMFAIMCHHPEVQRKIHDELDLFISTNGQIPDYHERANVPYCFAVIRECMRYRSTTFFGLAHSVVEDVIIDGYLLPKGSILSTGMMSIHQNPDFYENPEEFNPERFLPNTKSMHSAASGKLEERDHFNFGWGRRICAGIHLAETELFYTFIQVLSRCFIEQTSLSKLPDLDGAKNGGISILPLPYQVKFTRRSTILV